MDISLGTYTAPSGLWDELISLTTSRHYNKNEIIQMQGEPPVTIYFLLSGKWKISNLFPNGEERLVYICYAPFMYGETSYLKKCGFGRGKYNSSLIAMTDCQVASAPADYIWDHFKDNPDFKDFLIQMLSLKSDGAYCQSLSIGTGLTFEQKTANVLLNINEFILSLNNNVRDTITITQNDLAKLMFAARPSVTRQLQKFVSMGLITTSRGNIIIKDREGLSKLALLDRKV